MFHTWTFGKRLAAGFGLAGLTLLVIGIVSFRTTDALIRDDGRVAHTNEVRYKLVELMSQLKDAETGQRGYIITGDDAYLQPYAESLTKLDETIATLQRLTADNPSQQERLADLAQSITARIAPLRQAIDLRRTRGLEAGASAVIEGGGKALMDHIRNTVAQADKAERDLLVERAAVAERSASMAKAITLWGGLAGAIIIGVIGWFISASLSRRVGDAVGQVRSSSAELQAAANQQATGSRQQATAM
jgi:CHASE3 domain sensor protein